MKRISKTIFILILFAWIGNGINAEAQQRHPHNERAIHRSLVMNKQDFQFLYKTIKLKSFESDRLELLSVGVLDNYFNCRQCVKLISLCSFDNEKLKVLDIMAKHIVDLEHADLILESFTFDSNREKAAKALGLY